MDLYNHKFIVDKLMDGKGTRLYHLCFEEIAIGSYSGKNGSLTCT